MAADVIGFATTTIDVYRDVDAASSPDTTDADLDAFGDEIETPRPDTAGDADIEPDPLLRAVPASIIEQTQRAPDPSSGDLRAVRAITGRVGGEVDVRTGDRIRDRLDGGWYSVDATTRPQNPAGLLDLRLELTRVS